jgi:hypothetical protein
MISRERFQEDLEALDPDLVRQLGPLWAELRACPAPPEPSTGRRVWARLKRSRSPFWIVVAAWWSGWPLLLNRRALPVLITVAAAGVLSWLGPVLAGRPELIWWGCLAPWAGLVAVPVLIKSTEPGPWSEWEAAAPFDPGFHTSVRWFSLLLAVTVLTTLLAWNGPSFVETLHLVLMWVGPFSLTSLATMLMARRIGITRAVVLAGAFWGFQLLAGFVGGIHGPVSWAFWFMDLKTALWPDLAALAASLVVMAVRVDGQARRWISG